MPASATSTAWASRPSTALIDVVPAGAASAMALPRSVTALITWAGSTAPAAARAPYSPTEWPAAASGLWPAREAEVGTGRVVDAVGVVGGAGEVLPVNCDVVDEVVDAVGVGGQVDREGRVSGEARLHRIPREAVSERVAGISHRRVHDVP